MSSVRIGEIEAAIDQELDRQAKNGARRIDIHAMAEKIDELLRNGQSSYSPRAQMRGAKRPTELNASNDG
jgi:hypothetical protein